MFSPKLATRNEGLVVVRRWELLMFLEAVQRAGHRLDAHTFAEYLVPVQPALTKRSRPLSI